MGMNCMADHGGLKMKAWEQGYTHTCTPATQYCCCACSLRRQLLDASCGGWGCGRGAAGLLAQRVDFPQLPLPLAVGQAQLAVVVLHQGSALQGRGGGGGAAVEGAGGHVRRRGAGASGGALSGTVARALRRGFSWHPQQSRGRAGDLGPPPPTATPDPARPARACVMVTKVMPRAAACRYRASSMSTAGRQEAPGGPGERQARLGGQQRTPGVRLCPGQRHGAAPGRPALPPSASQAWDPTSHQHGRRPPEVALVHSSSTP